MYYSNEVVDEVIRRNDIVDVIGSYISLKRRGSNAVGLCPFHNEKTPSFSVNGARQMYKCFGCGKAGSVLTFVIEYEGLGFPDALKLLADRVGYELPKQDFNSKGQQIRAEKRQKLLEMYRIAATYYYKLLRSETGKEGLEYLSRRALSPETMKKFGLGFAPAFGSELYKMLKEAGYNDELIKESELFSFSESFGLKDKFFNRVMFPIMDRNSKVIAFGGRVMGDAKPKYLNSNNTAIFDKSRNLFALNLARKSRRSGFILCEGYMDVISLHQAGFDNAIASLGTALTEQQAILISRYTKNVFITYDSDQAGRSAARRAIPILRDAGISSRVVNMNPYKDPDEFIKALGREEYEKRLTDAIPGFYYITECIAAEHDMEDPAEKTKFFYEVADEILKLEDELERSNYCAAVAKKYGVSPDDFRKVVNKRASKLVPVSESRRSHEETYEVLDEETESLDADRFKKEKLLLTWSMEHKVFGRYLLEYFTPEDFQPGVPRRVAELAFSQLKNNNGVIEPAMIASRFESIEEQRLSSEMLQASLWEEMGDDKAGIITAFVDSVSSLLIEKCNDMIRSAALKNDGAQVSKLLLKKSELGKGEFRKKLLERLNKESDFR